MARTRWRGEGGAVEAVERAVAVEGMAFLLRAWKSRAAGAWFWSAYAEDHPWAESGTRPWPSSRLALAAAEARLERTFGAADAASPR